MRSLEANLASVRRRIGEAAARSGRDPGEITLVAVTKTFPVETCREALAAGIGDLGENYVRELRDKATALPEVRWHYVGTLQTHTARHVAEHAQVAHGAAPGQAVAKLAERAAALGRRLPVLIQVDFTGARTGVHPDALDGFAEEVAVMEGLALSGLMTLPPFSEDAQRARPYFRRLREMRDDLREHLPQVSELSMGMSLDFEVAVEEGATMVRIGTALFGERAKR